MKKVMIFALILALVVPAMAFAKNCPPKCVDVKVSGFVIYCYALPDAGAKVTVAVGGHSAWKKANFIGYYNIKVNDALCCAPGNLFLVSPFTDIKVTAASKMFQGAVGSYLDQSENVNCCKPKNITAEINLITQ